MVITPRDHTAQSLKSYLTRERFRVHLYTGCNEAIRALYSNVMRSRSSTMCSKMHVDSTSFAKRELEDSRRQSSCYRTITSARSPSSVTRPGSVVRSPHQ